MTLAIDDGNPVRKKTFNPWPEYGEEEKAALIRALEQGQWWRMSGGEVTQFEKEFADFHGAASAVAVTNGTHALEVALLAHGIGPGDEVIVPAFTFISTSMAVQRVGAVPVPVDIDLDTYCMDPECVEQALTKRSAAIIPVHMAGHVADMKRLGDIALRHGLVLIQDAAHAHGAVSDNRRIGEWGSTACFSFQNFKLMTSGEGGAIIFSDEELRERAFVVHNCGRPMNDRVYEHQLLGSNYRLNEFSAAVLREQLKRLPEQNERRERNAALLYGRLREVEGIIPQKREGRVFLHPHYMIMLRIDPARLGNIDRDLLVKGLNAEGVPAFMNYRPIYQTDAFWQHPAPEEDAAFWKNRCPNTEKIFQEGIWIHHRVLLGGEEDIVDIVEAIKKIAGMN